VKTIVRRRERKVRSLHCGVGRLVGSLSSLITGPQACREVSSSLFTESAGLSGVSHA